MNITIKTLIITAALSTIAFGPTAATRGGGAGEGPVKASALAPNEAATLTFIREEEKMARDVYLAMDAAWGLPVFAQIAASEQEHMDAIKRMLDKYGLPDPALGVGVFADPLIQGLYNQLIASGMTSEYSALMAGAYIEEYDVLDLLLAIQETDKPDLQQVYGNLEAGSENHLRAFVAQIEESDVTYTAQYAPQSMVDEILAATSDSGQREQNRGR